MTTVAGQQQHPHPDTKKNGTSAAAQAHQDTDDITRRPKSSAKDGDEKDLVPSTRMHEFDPVGSRRPSVARHLPHRPRGCVSSYEQTTCHGQGGRCGCGRAA
eukprot:TRINITY_DN49610_c0_g1_i1.p3 TRINITY_DN49610_c0_g1~~TRINITY_DN49610_c0_g1_i1.p3  ORF type:complete len:102 (-),score=3.46 TRINITY_DN49610_c0_g1_i1:302-607(-)